ncbi:hypothetical protein CENDO_09030 [Corynebacterium endometrii]|uniref:TetR/AcrR family transcriptional regulator n=1 Tax=Corynebacterium endometrii TaxID=2488819 RepID=A0A4P7QH00_9CORY|nr:hypothetical protein [Corynebacterium endometrii]QCB29071.1 hypothetical protein CENDO_09030 [Corynebacterium endometrii]
MTATSDTEILVPRRRPAQARSRERFERILQAARDVLVETGFESFGDADEILEDFPHD